MQKCKTSSLASLKHIPKEMWAGQGGGASNDMAAIKASQAREHSSTRNDRGIHAQCRLMQMGSK